MKIKEFLYSNTLLKVSSLLLAFGAWLIVVENVDRETFATFRSVKIDMKEVEDSISTLGLDSIMPEADEATVQVNGIMYAVGNLNKEDIEIVPDISKVTGAGVYELPLVGHIKGSNSEDIAVTGINPSRITVKFDTLHTKILPVETNLNGIKGESGYLIQDEMITPPAVSITGPEAEVSRVKRCEVQMTVKERLSQTYSKKSKIVLLDKAGNVIESPNITLDIQEATVTIPVLKIRSVPVELQFMNVPKNFPLDKLKFTLSNEKIEVAGPEESVEKYASVLLDHIDFKQMGPQSIYAFPLQLPNSFYNVENIQSIQVSLDSENLASRKFNIENIQVVNAPLGYNAQAMAQLIPDVEIVGDKAVLETLSPGDIIAEVDLRSNSEIETGQVLKPVKIYIPNGSLAWARGNYEVVVSIQQDANHP